MPKLITSLVLERGAPAFHTKTLKGQQAPRPRACPAVQVRGRPHTTCAGIVDLHTALALAQIKITPPHRVEKTAQGRTPLPPLLPSCSRDKTPKEAVARKKEKGSSNTYCGYTLSRAQFCCMKRHRMYLAALLTSGPPVYSGK
jgi:hypothetical protein